MNKDEMLLNLMKMLLDISKLSHYFNLEDAIEFLRNTNVPNQTNIGHFLNQRDQLTNGWRLEDGLLTLDLVDEYLNSEEYRAIKALESN